MWLENLFEGILHMSLTASFVILLVMLARVVLRKAPKIYSYFLWGVVLFRLLCPVTFTSELSLMPEKLLEAKQITVGTDAGVVFSTEQGMEAEDQKEAWSAVPEEQENQNLPVIKKTQATDTLSGEDVNEPVVIKTAQRDGVSEYSENLTDAQDALVQSSTSNLSRILGYVWLLGITVLLIYSMVSLWKLKETLQCVVHYKENIYEGDYIDTPFTLGVFRPRIYLPSGLPEGERGYVIAHEKHHITRLDHIVKLVAFAALCLHWFNPLVWVAFVLAGKDMEMSCDEAVMAKSGEDIRAAYSTSLLRLSTGRNMISIVPLAFGEGNVKERIKNVMNYKKPSFWMIVISVVICIVLGICLCSNPESEEMEASEESMESTETLSEELTAEPQMREVTVWQEKVDCDGDGVEDMISFVIQADDSYAKFKGVTDGHQLLMGPFQGSVTCVSGATGELNFESAKVSHDRLGNYQISYAEIDGKHYMITTEIGEQMGDGYYYYEIYCLTTQELVDSYEIHFVTAGDDFRARPTASYRQEVVPEFQKRLEQWTKDAVLIVATDVNEAVEDGIFVSTGAMSYEPSYYYDLIWERMLDEEVRVDSYGLKVELPEEEGWIQNPQYLLSDYPVAHIKYYDSRVEAPLLLRYGKMEHMDLAYLYDVTFDEELQTVWYAGEGEKSVEVLCRVSEEASEERKKTVLVSWSYEALNYVIFGELDSAADETVLAKTAIYVIEHFKQYETTEDKIYPLTEVTESPFETRYFKFDLPEELVGKVSYRELWDGKCVTFYHTATIENYEYGGVLGDVWLRTQEEALSALGMNGRYIGEPDGEEVCLVTTPTDVQWEIGSPQEEEFLELAKVFESRQFPGYVTLKDADHEAALTQIARLDYDMGYQSIACEGQTILGFLDGNGQEDTLCYSHVRGGKLGGIYVDTIVPEIIINGKEYTLTDGLQGIDFALPVTSDVSGYYRLPYGIFDFDKDDGYREILLVAEDSTAHLLIYAFRYDAGELIFLGNSGRLLDDSSFMVTSEGKLMVMQENGREIMYRIEDNRLVPEKNIVGSEDWRKEWRTID